MSSDPTVTSSSSDNTSPEAVQTPAPTVEVVEPGGEIVTVRQASADVAASPAQQAQFSGSRWFLGGIVRILYRTWTRVAVRVFPENSETERIARRLHIPLPDQLNMSWVTDHLAVGGRIHPKDIPSLELLGITAVVDTRAEYHDEAALMEQAHIQLLLLPAPDTHPLTVEQLFAGSQWAQERMQRGGCVLVHCEHGVGRSVLLTAAVLVYGGMPAHEALQLVQKKRWQASPNHRQVTRLREFEAAVAARGDRA